jgi:hypothetical protein
MPSAGHAQGGGGGAGGASGGANAHIQFQHTQLGVYLVGVCALVYTALERGQVRCGCRLF